MAEIIVTSTADSGAGTLRAAINAARDGDVILFDADVFPEGQTTSILLSSSFVLTHNITIDAGEPVEYLGVVREVDGVDTIVEITPETPAQEGEHPTLFLRCRVALDGQDGWRIATVGQNRVPSLRGLELTRGLNSGAILNIYSGSTTTLINCSVIRGVSSQTSAPIICVTGTQIFQNCVFALNQGRGVFWNQGDSTQTFEGCRFIANHTDANGGVLRFDKNATGAAVLDNCVFIDNSANKSGGAIYTASLKQVILTNCSIINCSANNAGGGLYSDEMSQNTLNDCIISGCSATNSGGGVFSANTSQNTLNNCQIVNCSATSGGGVFSADTSQNTLNACTFNACTANYGGGFYSSSSSYVILNDCVITDCVSNVYAGGACIYSNSHAILNACAISGCTADTRGGGLYALNSSQATLNNCVITWCHASLGGGAYFNNSGGTSIDNCAISGNTSSGSSKDVLFDNLAVATISATQIGYYYSTGSATVTFADGVTTIATPRIDANATITIADGAALTITTTATIGAATFTSAGRGYLALAPGIDASAATLTNVVLCSYGADASQFHEDLGVLYWDAADPTTPVLLEYEVEVEGAAQWVTLIRQTTGESYTRYFGPSVNLRLFDGEKFLTTSTPSSRTYYYIGGAEGSFTAAADWSLTRGGYAIPEPPTVKDCTFIVGDVSAATEEETTEETTEP